MFWKEVGSCFRRLTIWFVSLLYFSARFVVVELENVDGGEFGQSFQHFPLVIVCFSRKTPAKRVSFSFYQHLQKVSFWTLVLSSTFFRNWQPNQTVRHCLSTTMEHRYFIPVSSDFEFSDTFKVFKGRIYSTLLFAWPNNEKNFSINLIISS